MEQPLASPPQDAFALLVGRMIGNMRFLGWYYIIMGGLTCLTIIGAIFGVPMLISGLRLREACDEFEQLRSRMDYEALYRGFDRQNRFFFIQKVFVIISLVFVVLYFILIFFFIGLGVLSGTGDGLDGLEL